MGILAGRPLTPTLSHRERELKAPALLEERRSSQQNLSAPSSKVAYKERELKAPALLEERRSSQQNLRPPHLKSRIRRGS
jgi:hypothetical protein